MIALLLSCNLNLQKVTVEYVPQVGYLVAVQEHEVHLLDHILPTSTAPPTVTSSPPAQHPAPYVPQYSQQYAQQPQQQFHPTHNIPYMRGEDPYGGEEEFLAWSEPSGVHSLNRYDNHHQVPFVEAEEPVQVRITTVFSAKNEYNSLINFFTPFVYPHRTRAFVLCTSKPASTISSSASWRRWT